MPLEDTTADHPHTAAAAAAAELPPPLHQLNHTRKASTLPRHLLPALASCHHSHHPPRPPQNLSPHPSPPCSTAAPPRTVASAFLSWAQAPTPLSSLFDSCAPPNRRLRILELGSDTGAVGIAAAALLGASVTITDLPHVLPNLQFNVAANAKILELHGGAVDAAALQWGQTTDVEAIGREYDVILGSDLVYHENL
ncbi:UNVERIFIED_CONTAM: hypothetical protein Sindi_0775600 [Sesamum indicum]